MEFVDETEIGNKYLISNNPDDLKYAKTHPLMKNWNTNPKKITRRNNDIIVLRGNRVQVLQQYNYLFN